MPNVKIALEETLDKIGVSRNALAVEGKIRPATINELCRGESKAISFATLAKIINALNTLDQSGKRYEITDIITIDYEL